METQFSNLGKVLNEQCMKMYNESRKELEAYKTACKDNEALIDELKQENTDLEDALAEATNKIKDMQNEIYETRSWRDSWKNAYTDRGNWIERLLDQKDELNKEIEDLKKLATSGGSNAEHISKLLHDISISNEQLSKKNIEITGLNSHIKELESEIDNLKKRIAFKKHENEPTDEEIFAILESRGYYGNLVKQTEIQIGA